MGSLLTSCTEKGNVITGETVYSTEVIEGCEYLRRYEGYQNGYTFTHKGNCKNKAHDKVIYDTIYVIH